MRHVMAQKSDEVRKYVCLYQKSLSENKFIASNCNKKCRGISINTTKYHGTCLNTTHKICFMSGRIFVPYTLLVSFPLACGIAYGSCFCRPHPPKCVLTMLKHPRL